MKPIQITDARKENIKLLWLGLRQDGIVRVMTRSAGHNSSHKINWNMLSCGTIQGDICSSSSKSSDEVVVSLLSSPFCISLPPEADGKSKVSVSFVAPFNIPSLLGISKRGSPILLAFKEKDKDLPCLKELALALLLCFHQLCKS